MPAPYDYAAAGGYDRSRPDWVDFPSTSTPIQQVHLDRIDQALYDLKHFPINIKDYTGADDAAIINAACSDARAKYAGGPVVIPPGSYTIGSTIDASGCVLMAQSGIPGSTSGEVTYLNHNFNGTFIQWTQPSTTTVGGGMKGIYLNNNSGKTGDCLKVLAAASSSAMGRFFFEDITITGATGFDRCVNLDGSAATNGVRQTFFRDCSFFGAETVGETVRLNKVVACHFSNCSIYQAPSAVVGGLKVVNAFSSDVYWYGGTIAGTVDTAAAGNSVTTQAGLVVDASVEGNITCQSGSARNRFYGHLAGTYTNSGDASNRRHDEISYAEITSNATITATTEGTANAVIAGTAKTYDAQPIIVEFYSPKIMKGTTSISVVLFDSTTALGILGETAAGSAPCFAAKRFTPTAASHTYNIKAYVDAGTGFVVAGAGGAGQYEPAFMRIKAAN